MEYFLHFFVQVTNIVQKQVSFTEQNVLKWAKTKSLFDEANENILFFHIRFDQILKTGLFEHKIGKKVDKRLNSNLFLLSN